jgi:hypothetical protein
MESGPRKGGKFERKERKEERQWKLKLKLSDKQNI